MKKNNSLLKFIAFIIIAFFVVINNDNKTTTEDFKEIKDINEMRVHFIDVSQGDSIFIELPNNQTMLIDAGEKDKGLVVSNYIKNSGYKSINYLIGTHPHSDHIGGMSEIIKTFNIEKIYMPKALSTSKTYENLLSTIANKGLKITTAKSGLNIINDNNLKINIIAPNKTEYESLNNYSAVIKIEYINKSFLFMGDAESISENEITYPLKADVIKVGHHGSRTSSSKAFLNKVNPEYAIIMVGKDNDYNHPHEEIINRYTKLGTKILRTDLSGNIIISTNGDKLNIKEGATS